MIIFGTRSMESVRKTGTFNCPRCGTSKLYRHKSVNRWFTLYFIPVIPLGSVGSYIQCSQCGGTYTEAILSYDPEAEARKAFFKLRGLLVRVAMYGNTAIDEDTIRAIGEAYLQATGSPITSANIYQDIDQAKTPLAQYAAQLAPQLNFQGKALFLRAAIQVLHATGSPRSDASAVIGELAKALAITPQQLQQILA